MTKIFWSPDEQEAVYAAMVELFVSNPIARKEVALQTAQTVLPMERRRKIHYSVVYRYKELIDRARAAAKNRPKEPVQEPITPAAPPQTPTDLLRTILDQLLDALADKVVERIQQRQEPQEQPAPPHRPKHDPSPISGPRPGKVGVLVIGLLNQQASTIINLFPHLEFTCLTPEQALSREQLRRSHTILMTKFINHSVQGKYRKVENLHLCNGGVSELSAILKSIS
jgi:hypothetical protein